MRVTYFTNIYIDTKMQDCKPASGNRRAASFFRSKSPKAASVLKGKFTSMKARSSDNSWQYRISVIKNRLDDEDFCSEFLRDLECSCREDKFREEFLKSGNFEIFHVIFSHISRGVIGEMQMIGEFNKELKKELFDKWQINHKLTRYFLPAITTLWTLTTG